MGARERRAPVLQVSIAALLVARTVIRGPPAHAELGCGQRQRAGRAHERLCDAVNEPTAGKQQRRSEDNGQHSCPSRCPTASDDCSRDDQRQAWKHDPLKRLRNRELQPRQRKNGGHERHEETMHSAGERKTGAKAFRR